jgi:uncharacterized membrane protein
MPKPDGAPDVAPLAEHVAESVDAIAALHSDHYRTASGLQRTLDAATEILGRPITAAGLAVGVAAWIGATFALTSGHVAEPSFTWLELTATVMALLVAMLILVTQRRQDKLSERRAQLTLELAVLADRKNAKIIALLEELRRDHPDVRDRQDTESDEMAKPADPRTVLAALDERAGEAVRSAGDEEPSPDA